MDSIEDSNMILAEPRNDPVVSFNNFDTIDPVISFNNFDTIDQVLSFNNFNILITTHTCLPFIHRFLQSLKSLMLRIISCDASDQSSQTQPLSC